MKKICALVFALLSTTAFAQDLRCEKDYGLFKKQYAESIDILKTGSLDDLKKFLKKNDYTVSNSRQNLSKSIFFYGAWISPQEYDEQLKLLFDTAKSKKFENLNFLLSTSKANYISSIGEICVVPVQTEDIMSGEKYISKYDLIIVRNLKSNEWKGYIYLGIEEKSDINYFFPNLKAKVKLSQLMSNDKNFADNIVEVALTILKERGVEPSDELIDAVNMQAERFRAKLKENGHL